MIKLSSIHRPTRPPYKTNRVSLSAQITKRLLHSEVTGAISGALMVILATEAVGHRIKILRSASAVAKPTITGEHIVQLGAKHVQIAKGKPLC